MNKRRSFPVDPILIALLLMSVTVLVLGSTRSRAPEGAASQSLEPWRSLSELVENKDAIVVGSVSGAFTETIAIDPTEIGGWPTGVPTMDATEQVVATRWKASLHEVISSEALLGGDDVAETEHFQVRMLGHPSLFQGSTEVRFQHYPDPEGEYLFFLGDLGPGAYSLHAMGMFRLDSNTVTWPDGETPFDLADGMTSEQFLEAIRDEIEEQY
ncbi:MAG: hypothetical protein IT332_11880 [Ardenticatenales bacterium]|nr:hypothetical protein [Ardenticatenales bacterium]